MISRPQRRQPSSAATTKEYPDIQTIRNAIPAHCFEPSTWRSLGYVLRDVTMAISLGWAALTYIPSLPNSLWRGAAWMAYGYAQGLVCTGIWILAHEAGHGAFSVHRTLNNIVGWVLHSSLMVPYFSWKFSHHRHHRFTGHMDKDMAFVPMTAADRSQPRFMDLYIDLEHLEDVPIVQFARLIAHQLVGWQTYLLFNSSAGVKSKQRDESSWWRLSHFDPTSAVFRPNEAAYIALSDLGLGLTFSVLYYASTIVGWYSVCLVYVIPYLWVHHWLSKSNCLQLLHSTIVLMHLNCLVAITYLHHNHPDVPHYSDEGWTFVKGNLATIDRDFGWIGRHLFHGIIDTHVVHHLFP